MEGDDVQSNDAAGLAALAASAVDGRSPPAGPEWRRKRGPLPPLVPQALAFDKPLCASLDGFTLHAATRAGALDALGREALCKYVLRPAVAQERITQGPDGLVRIVLKKPFSDGTVAVDMDPLSLLCRLAASVPPPRLHTVRYAGVLAPASKLRPRIVPKPPATPANDVEPGALPLPPKPGGSRYRPWAELLKRCFSIDVLQCASCGGRMKLVALRDRPPAGPAFPSRHRRAHRATTEGAGARAPVLEEPRAAARGSRRRVRRVERLVPGVGSHDPRRRRSARRTKTRRSNRARIPRGPFRGDLRAEGRTRAGSSRRAVRAKWGFFRLRAAVNDLIRVRRDGHVVEAGPSPPVPRPHRGRLRAERADLQAYSPSRSSVTRNIEPSSAMSSSSTLTAPSWPTLFADIAFAQKAASHLRIQRQLGVEHLDRGAPAVTVRARVDSRHAADAKQDVETPLVAQGLADSVPRTHEGGV